MNSNKSIEKIEIEKRDLLLAKAKLIDEIESGSKNQNSFHQLGETVFNIYKIERDINRLTENIIQS